MYLGNKNCRRQRKCVYLKVDTFHINFRAETWAYVKADISRLTAAETVFVRTVKGKTFGGGARERGGERHNNKQKSF
jgi:hypothetical protein